ncbi:hypothetical protein TELCIR_00349 [Teladorsagia circumcincta]|uniref:G-protein coupled receptors family 1 profile domain-containing protein n=1 Tax=Teladorsagia circumcincta TaxID=45464 RepID=A0A2G9V4W0_TELCI|nr:hypothetical protein TELCIR_00349 [Teladorsagia circumcincta]
MTLKKKIFKYQICHITHLGGSEVHQLTEVAQPEAGPEKEHALELVATRFDRLPAPAPIWTLERQRMDLHRMKRDELLGGRVFCVITTPLVGHIYTVVLASVVVIDLLIVICYMLFFCTLKKSRISYDVMKNIYRSLVVISLAVVLGSFSTVLIGLLFDALTLNTARADMDLLTGLFINSSCSINFFIFYTTRVKYGFRSCMLAHPFI